MSEMSSVSDVSTEEAAQHEGKSNTFRAIGCGLLVLAAVVAVLFITGTIDVSAEKADAATDEESSGGSSGGNTYTDNYATKKKTTTTQTSTEDMGTTESVTTVQEESSVATEEITEETTATEEATTPAPPPRVLVLCTISHRGILPTMYPKDGVCDLLFYTAVRFFDNKQAFSGAYDEFSFDLFLDKAKGAGSNAKTGYGVSFDYRYADLAAAAVSSHLDDLWKQNVHHYGLLHVWDNIAELAGDNKLFNVLKEVKKRQDDLADNELVHRAVGFQFKTRHGYLNSSEVVRNLQRNYAVTIIITITHVFKAPRGSWSQGPTSWTGDLVPYPMKNISAQWTKFTFSNYVWMMPSFSMQIAMWRIDPDYAGKNTTFKEGWWKILSYTPAAYESACKDYPKGNNTVHVDPWGFYMYSGSMENKLLVSWDTEETMINKTKMFFNVVKEEPPKFGLALYDVDYDDYSNQCKKRPFSRVEAMSKYIRR
ncbi:uncharacterized protein LOC144103472 [Amblyomma americanum]